MQSYSFPNIAHGENHAEITDDGQLVVRIGFGKKSAPLNSLRVLYIKHYRSMGTKELILGYETKAGKKKNIRIHTDEECKELHELADELCRRCPDLVDLRSWPEEEALKELNTVDAEKVAFWMVPILSAAFLAFMFIPQFIHSLDSGHVEMEVSELDADHLPDTYNLSLTGRPLLDKGVVVYDDEDDEIDYVVVPLVSSSWDKTKPITVLLKSDEMINKDENEQLLRSQTFEVILRNALWEGSSSDDVEFLQEKYGFRFVEDPLLVEVRKHSNLGLLISGILSVVASFVVMTIVSGVIWHVRYSDKASKAV